MSRKFGFTLVEILVGVTIIAVITALITIATSGVQKRGRDTKRKSELAQFGRFISLSCYIPDAGAGDYDLAEILEELKESSPKYSAMITKTPKDPLTGTAEDTGYRYIVSVNGKNCAFYVNLENEVEEITNDRITVPTPGGGTGTFKAGVNGRNGSPIYFQISN